MTPCLYCDAPVSSARSVTCGARPCKLKAKAQRERERHALHGRATRTKYDTVCQDCGITWASTNKDAKTCAPCQRRAAAASKKAAALAHKAVLHAPDAGGFCWLPDSHPARHPSRLYQALPCNTEPKRLFVSGTCRECQHPFLVHGQGSGIAAFCSDHCQMRAMHRRNKHRRRARLLDAYVEDVSWRTLYNEGERDCYLCNEPVDLDDYTTPRPGVFVAGPSFPSLDHYHPLSKGGQHSRANARLAHALCNSEKCDQVFAVA